MMVRIVIAMMLSIPIALRAGKDDVQKLVFYDLDAFHKVVLDGDFDAMKRAWEAGETEEQRNYLHIPVFMVNFERGEMRDNHFLMHLVAEGGSVDIARFLLERSDELGEQADFLCPYSWSGETPLHRAAACGHVDMVAWLLGYYRQQFEDLAWVTSEDEGTRPSPLLCALNARHLGVMRVLLKVDIPPVKTVATQTFVHEASEMISRTDGQICTPQEQKKDMWTVHVPGLRRPLRFRQKNNTSEA